MVSILKVENGMLLNRTKTDAMLCGTHAQQQKVDVSSGIDVAGAHVSFSGSIKLLGVELDSALSIDGHVSNVVRGCNYHIRALRHIRPLLDLDTAKMLAQEIVAATSALPKNRNPRNPQNLRNPTA